MKLKSLLKITYVSDPLNPPNPSNLPNPLNPSNPPNPRSPPSPSHPLNPCPHPPDLRFKDSRLLSAS